jgi:hypothetical protein
MDGPLSRFSWQLDKYRSVSWEIDGTQGYRDPLHSITVSESWPRAVGSSKQHSYCSYQRYCFASGGRRYMKRAGFHCFEASGDC